MDSDDHLGRAKRAAEKFAISYNFDKDAATGDNIASATITATRESDGGDVSGTFLETPGTSGQVATVTLKDGSVDTDYTIQFEVTMVSGAIFQRRVRVQVRA